MKNYAEKVESVTKSLSKVVCIAGGWLLIFLSVMICVEVFLRKVFNHSLQGVDEYGGYALALTSALGFAYAFYEGSHIKIDVLVRLLPRPFRIGSALLAQVSLLIVASILAHRAVLQALDSWELQAFANTPLRTPLYIPQAIWAAGICLFVAALAIRMTRILEGTFRKQWPELIALLDTDQQGEEIEEVLSEVETAEAESLLHTLEAGEKEQK